MASPLLPTLAAPMGHTRTLPPAFARSRMKRVTLALLLTGLWTGMQQTAVNPPRAAARVPDSILSEDAWLGSRRCACRSINPGATMRPAASKTSASRAEVFPAGATSAMRSPSRRTSRAASVFRAGSTTRPFLTSSMRGVLYIRGASISRLLRFINGVHSLFAVPGNQQKEQRHAHRDAVGHLVEHARLRAIGNFRGNLNAAVHRSRM